jgi:hypothetical protein
LGSMYYCTSYVYKDIIPYIKEKSRKETSFARLKRDIIHISSDIGPYTLPNTKEKKLDIRYKA